MPGKMTAKEEKYWDRAKVLVRKQYPGKEKSDKNGFYALVTSIFQNIKKGSDKKDPADESIDLDWSAALSVLNPAKVVEDRLDIRTEAEDLSVGAFVVITTKLGRTMAEGIVLNKSDGDISIRTSANGVDQDRTFSTDLYDFFMKRTDEDALTEGGVVTVDVRSDVPDDPADSATTGPLPIRAQPDPETRKPVQFLVDVAGGDRRYAEEMWNDILSYGFNRAMARHKVLSDDQIRLKSVLAPYIN